MDSNIILIGFYIFGSFMALVSLIPSFMVYVKEPETRMNIFLVILIVLFWMSLSWVSVVIDLTEYIIDDINSQR